MASEREKFEYYMNNLSELDAKLQEGAEKTRKIAAETLKRVPLRSGKKVQMTHKLKTKKGDIIKLLISLSFMKYFFNVIGIRIYLY